MRKRGSSTEMDGNEWSHSEYLNCNNACVKVTINRYKGLYSESLRTLHNGMPWPSLLHLLEINERLSMIPHAQQWFKESFLANTFMIIGMYVHFNHTLNQNVLDKAEKCKATDLSSLKAVFRGIVDITKGIDQQSFSLARIPACVHTVRLLQELVERYDPRHPSLRFCRLLMLQNFLFPEVIKAGKLLATLGLKNSYYQGLYSNTDFI